MQTFEPRRQSQGQVANGVLHRQRTVDQHLRIPSLQAKREPKPTRHAGNELEHFGFNLSPISLHRDLGFDFSGEH
jgi:hypothetical protein